MGKNWKEGKEKRSDENWRGKEREVRKKTHKNMEIRSKLGGKEERMS